MEPSREQSEPNMSTEKQAQRDDSMKEVPLPAGEGFRVRVSPQQLVPPVGYSHAYATQGGRTIYLAGQVSFDKEGKIVHAGDMVKQFDQALMNLQITMREAGGEMVDIVKLNIFVKSRDKYRDNMKSIGTVYRGYFGKHFPAMTLVEVSSLFEDDALIEIEGIAVIL